MTAGADQERLFVAELHPKLGEHLAKQLASGYDARAGRARFLAWLAEHAEDEEVPAGARAAVDDAADPLRAYLAQVSQVPGLSAEQEAALATRIRTGRYAEQKLAEGGSALTSDARIGLEWVAEDGRRAKNHLLEANLQLVVSLAKRYAVRGIPCSTWSRRETWAWSAPWRNSTPPRATGSPRTPPGGSGRRSRAR
jgi:DNA-directed RNA polymerase sigma subunit (sigma70/sigma32)